MPKRRRTAKQNNKALMRGIYLTIIIGIVAVIVIVTLESIMSVVNEASSVS